MQFRESEIVRDFNHPDKEKILKYIETMYSEKSDVNEITDLEARKKESCRRAGIDPESELGQTLIYLKDDSVGDLIFDFLSGHNSAKYSQLCADQQLLWEMQRELLKPIDGDNLDDRLKAVEYKDKISVRCNGLLSRINKGYSEVYKYEDEIRMAVRTIHDMLSYEQRLKKYITDVPADQQPI
jgi:predicted transcriptional regulator with HTH domain